MAEHIARVTGLEGLGAKAGVVRGHMLALRRRGILDRVCARLDPEMASLLRDPPVASVWVSGNEIGTLLVAIEAEVGLSGMRAYHIEAIRAGMLPLAEGFVSGILRLFNASPASLLSRLPDLNAQQTRGTTFTFVSRDASAGALFARFDCPQIPPPGMRESIAATAVLVLELCNVKGEVSAVRKYEDTTSVRWGCEVRW